MTFNYVSLFSGIGGFEQALNKLGGTCVMASEIDKYANQSYEILYGHPTVGDVMKVAAEEVPDHDVLVGGFPCQAFSVAGKRLGFDDTRGTLFFEIARIAKVKRPKALLLENVKGLISHDKGKTLDTIIQTLADIGYTLDFNVLNSKYFDVPQNRERIFIIAVRDDLIEQHPWQIEGSNVVAKGKRRISEIEGVKTFNFDWPAQEEVATRLRDILEDNVDEKYYLSEEKTAKLVAQLNDGAGLGKDGELGTVIDGGNISPCIDASYAKGIGPSDVAKNRNRRPHMLELEPQMLGHIGLKGHDAIRRVYSTTGVSPTLTTMGGGHREPKIAEEVRACLTPEREEKRQNGPLFKPNDEPAHTINTQDRHGVAYGSYPKYRIRKLTPRECFRLQGFPDSEFDKLVEGGISNSQLYKQAGNAVTVNVISAIGKRLITYLN
ncbi:DNA (cytosine-5-)-methyltransferase [Bacillus sp. PK3-056]|uniref:DNA (cytosine-5-)-methyltransferase n=1 Tax=Niallia circulans TaxID=1397 RepID=UPI000F44915C|nr:DNA (cytosine-5-)-methyltransferase [Niallia circulans]AYV74306.1 DNA (cytosine-5-)-methyltransferase [Niallia circulans]